MAEQSQQKVQAVTGAFGFLGKYIAARLLQAGQSVVTLTGSPERENSFKGTVAARPFRFDSVAAMAESLRDVDVLYNTYWVRFANGGVDHEAAVRNSTVLFEAAKQAGVSRIVHVSIANPDAQSKFPYYKGKAQVEQALFASGVPYSIVRPAALYGTGGVLVNNIAWTLRRLPVFCYFGKGDYHIQPAYVDDVAALMVEQAAVSENTVINALGPQDFAYCDFVSALGDCIGYPRPSFGIPVWMGYASSWVIGKLMHDVFVTRDEIEVLMSDLLHVPGAEATCPTRLTDWARENAATLGVSYANEVERHQNRKKAY